MASIVYVPIILALATLWLYFLIISVPSVKGNDAASLRFPSNLAELKDIAVVLKQHYKENRFYVYILFSSAYLYKQTFAIPGSVFLNVLSGALFGLVGGLSLVSFLNGTGASFCYLLSKYFGQEYIVQYFPERVAALRAKVEDNKNQLFYYLLFVRLFPMTPNWFINIASPILNIPLHLFFTSVFLGLMPFNFTCVQTGVVLSEINSMDDVFTYAVIFKMIAVAAVALLPSFFIRKRQKFRKSIAND